MATAQSELADPPTDGISAVKVRAGACAWCLESEGAHACMQGGCARSPRACVCACVRSSERARAPGKSQAQCSSGQAPAQAVVPGTAGVVSGGRGLPDHARRAVCAGAQPAAGVVMES